MTETQVNLLVSILNAGAHPQFVLDEEGNFVAFNDQYARVIQEIFGLKLVEYSNYFDVLSVQPTPILRQPFLKAIKGESISFLHSLRSKTGETYLFHEEMAPLKEGEEVFGVLVHWKAVTEVDTQASPNLSREIPLRSVFDHSPDSLFIVDRFGKITDVNLTACRITGISEKDFQGSSIGDVVPKDQRMRFMRSFYSLFLGALRYFETTISLKDGILIPAEVSGQRLIHNDNDCIIISLRDISERKKLELDRERFLLEKSKHNEFLVKESYRIRERERERISWDLHDEVGGTLSKISLMCQMIKSQVDPASPANSYIDKIIHSTRTVQQNIANVVWAMNPKNDSLDNLVSYLSYTISEFVESFDFECQMIRPTRIVDRQVSGSVRRSIFLSTKEAVHNVVKHSGAKSVKIQINTDEHHIEVFIRDKGKGFDTAHATQFSNGLVNMKKRMKEIGGVFELTSEAGTGTTVKLYYQFSSKSDQG